MAIVIRSTGLCVFAGMYIASNPATNVIDVIDSND